MGTENEFSNARERGILYQVATKYHQEGVLITLLKGMTRASLVH